VNLNPATGPLLKPSPRKRAPKRLKARVHVIPASIREQVLDKAGRVCEWCEVPGGALDCHHVIRRSQGGRDEAGNLRALHRICHAYLHANPSVAKARGFLA
jgi:5-methylcytosine-specific restriction endonuclease McrA